MSVFKIYIRFTILIISIGISVAVFKKHERDPRPPSFKGKPIHDIVALVGRPHTFQCKVSGYPKPFLTWYHGNEILSPSKRIKIGKSSLKISNLKRQDNGKYACKAVNQHGELWGNFTLQVVQDEDDVVHQSHHYTVRGFVELADLKGPPKFKKRLNNRKTFLSRAVTTSVEFDCDVTAYPVASINWFKNGKSVTTKPGKYIIGDFKLIVESLSLEDVGNYTCVVRNDYGSLTWTTQLEVKRRLAISPVMEDIKNQTTFTGGTVIFSCNIVISDSQTLLQWLMHFTRNGSYTNKKGEPYVKVIQESGLHATVNEPQHLVLHNVTKEDEGWYTCLVANTVGMNYRSAWLTIENVTSQINGDCHTCATREYSGETFTCTCKPGYTGDGYNCTNINECTELMRPCHEDYVCEDRDPGYLCLPQNAQIPLKSKASSDMN